MSFKPFLIISLLSVFGLAHGAPDTSLNTVNAKILKLKKNLQSNQHQHNQQETELANTDKKIARIVVELKTLENRLRLKKAELTDSKVMLASLEANLLTQKNLLGQQLRASYQLGQYEYLQLLLNQQNPSKTFRLITYYRYIQASRLATLAEIKNTEAEILKKQAIFAEQVAELNDLYKKQQASKALLEKTQHSRQKMMQTLKQKILTQSSQLKEYESDRKRLEALVLKLKARTSSKTSVPASKPASSSVLHLVHSVFSSKAPAISGSFRQSQHHLMWPTNGRILNRALVPILHHESRYNGVFIVAREGQPVMAIYPGKVVFASWLKGFGLLVILDHGQGFMTLYAGNQTLYRKRGDSVKAGDLIANVGHTGILSQSGLYFEIRYNGRPVNPLQWLQPGVQAK